MARRADTQVSVPRCLGLEGGNRQQTDELTETHANGGIKGKPNQPARYLLKVLQMSETALKTLSEKLTFTFTYFMLGSCRRSSLCCGVNCSLASAWIPYLSSVQ